MFDGMRDSAANIHPTSTKVLDAYLSPPASEQEAGGYLSPVTQGPGADDGDVE